jgi:NADH:ubiquinone oxidoreductase subunit 4 (subunit M)
MNISEFDRLPLELVTVVVCNLMGTMGYVRAMKDFDNLIISVAALMEPVVATFIAYGFHVGSLPGMNGWIGNALVALGTFGVVYPTATAKHK